MIEAVLPDGRTMILETALSVLAVFEPWEPPTTVRVGHGPLPGRAVWHLRLRETKDGRAFYEHVTPLWRATVEPWGVGMPTLLGYVEAANESDASWEAHCRWPNRQGRLRVDRVQADGAK